MDRLGPVQAVRTWIVIGVGIGFIAAGSLVWLQGVAEKYKERLRDTPDVERLDPVCKFGWTAYGVVIVILGCFLVWAGWTLDPSHAGGLADAFAAVRQAVFGRLLLGVLAFGVIASPSSPLSRPPTGSYRRGRNERTDARHAVSVQARQLPSAPARNPAFLTRVTHAASLSVTRFRPRASRHRARHRRA